MEKLLIKYFRNANSYQSIDPTCFNLQEFTEIWLEENKEDINREYCRIECNYVESKSHLNTEVCTRCSKLRPKQFLCGNEYRNKAKRCLKQCGNCQGSV